MEISLVAFTILLSTIPGLYLVRALTRLIYIVFGRPFWIQKALRLQGIRGPPYKILYGSTKELTSMRRQSMGKPMEISNDIFPKVQPHVYAWSKIYGKKFLSWYGPQAVLTFIEPELINEILMNKEDAYPKMEMPDYMKKRMGKSLITNEGEMWAKVRKVANRTFHAESLKEMVPEMCACVEKMLQNWKKYEGREINVYEEFRSSTMEVISRTAFGSSYTDGQHIFEMVEKLTSLVAKNDQVLRLFKSWLLRTNDDKEAENLERGIKSSIIDLVKQREKVMENNKSRAVFGNDYLGQLIKLVRDPEQDKRITFEQMIDEIKVLYGAGQLTTRVLLSWAIFLLASNMDWQEKARKEVLDLFGQENPTSDGLARLKTMNMIINETLRLYPPVPTFVRKVQRKVKLGKFTLPPNVNIFFYTLAVHHDPEIWGEDVHLFKPERFSQGVAGATKNNPGAFYPFGIGQRVCVGSNFSIDQAKITLSMILQLYKFSLSSTYIHCPTEKFLLIPEKGVQVVLQPI